MKNQKKAIVLGLTASMLMPVCFNSGTAEAAAADRDVAAMQAEINDLTARLTDLENSLAAAKEKQEAAKSEKKAKKEAPTIKWSGSTKSGYMYNEEKTGKIKAEASILARTVVDKTYDVGIGLKFKATSSEPKDGYSSEKNKVKLTDSYVGRSFGPVYVRAGVQKVSIGEGLWLSKSSVNQFTANYKMTPRDALYLGYGRDSQDYLANDTNKKYAPPTRTRLLKFAQYQHDFSKDAYAGLYVGTQQPERYFGIYGSTPIVGKFGITAEYVRNTNKDKPALTKINEDGADNGYGYKYFGANKNTQGYVISLNYGKAKKKGTWDIIGQYLNVDQNLFMDDGYSSWKDYIDAAGFKGFGLIMDYATSDHSKLSLLRYWAHTNPDDANVDEDGNSLEKSPHYSTYLKFTTKF